jgi:hypothetical protein
VILARYLNFKTSGEIAFKGGYPAFCLISKLLEYTVDQELVALCEAPHNKRMQQTIPPANKFASGLAPDPQRYTSKIFKLSIEMNTEKLNKGNELEQSIHRTLESSNLKDLLLNSGEFTFDLFIDSDVIKSIPVFNTIYGLFKVGLNIRDYIFVKKLYHFLYSFADVPHEERLSMLKRLENDTDFNQRVGEYLVLVIDRVDDYRKAALLSKAFKAYCSKKINSVQLLRLNQIIDRIFIPDFSELEKLYFEDSRMIEENPNAIPELNFISLGLAYIRSGFGANNISISSLGKLFVETIVR